MQVEEAIGAEGSSQTFVSLAHTGQGQLAGREAGLAGSVCYSLCGRLYFPSMARMSPISHA